MNFELETLTVETKTPNNNDLHPLDPALGGGDHVILGDVGQDAGQGDQADAEEAHHYRDRGHAPHLKCFICESQSPMENYSCNKKVSDLSFASAGVKKINM